ncbi:flagellar filament capping protein FliD [Alteromonas pelagimontana]|uniref:Flagellar hook-associated protein 2 n=1 Tax=Alteromonas pelagimontana TaxID=1858656 RepID=A0A6M4MF69_9ALTE|nr:flagellar filament capping protein FliD [Alteromonas pelagimontana]QJR81821.1 flagellar filament capping protein FliD [Alteromonas pelagimontana]
MSIQSLGVGSGLALDDLVKQLLEAERKPKEDRLTQREEKLESEISGLGQIKSKLSEFKDVVKELKSDKDINGRKPTITHPSEDIEIFTAEASSSAVEGNYKIAVSELASGSRIETASAADGGFAATTDSVLSAGSGSLTFKIGNTDDSFTVNVTAGMTLAELREAINKNADNFGVSANIIDTGTASGGAKLVFTSEVTGAGNDLSIINDNDLPELNRLATTDSAESAAYLSPVKAATNAKATIDGIAVESATNKFENTIQNVSFEAKEVSPFAADGVTIQASTLKIGYDSEATEEKIRSFVEKYNSMIDEVKKLTRYGESELEDDGALAGDSLIRGIQTGLASIIGGRVNGSELGGLFSLGIEMDADGKLEIGTSDFGLGSGEERLTDALEDNFDEVAKLFADEKEGMAVKLYDYLEQYTSSRGLLSVRERAAKDDQTQLYDDREKLEMRMASYEQILRDKYLNLDQTVSRLNQTSSALLASLG